MRLLFWNKEQAKAGLRFEVTGLCSHLVKTLRLGKIGGHAAAELVGLPEVVGGVGRPLAASGRQIATACSGLPAPQASIPALTLCAEAGTAASPSAAAKQARPYASRPSSLAAQPKPSIGRPTLTGF